MEWESIAVIAALAIGYWLAMGGDKARNVAKEFGKVLDWLLVPVIAPITWMNKRAAANESPRLRPVFWLWRMLGKVLLFSIIAALSVLFMLGKLLKPLSYFFHHLYR